MNPARPAAPSAVALLVGLIMALLVTGLAMAEPAAEPAPAEPIRSLRVGVSPIASIVEWNGEHPEGPMVAIWNELARRLGVQTQFIRIPTIDELISTVREGSIDVALGPLAITEERERSFDLTHPVFHSGLRIAVRQKQDSGVLAAVESMVSWKLVALIAGVVALAIASGHLLWWFERGPNPKSFPPDYPRGVGEAIWWIASTIVTGGCDDKHVDGPLGRILAFAWMVGGIGLIATFTSVLTATMTAEQVSGVIHGPRDLAGRVIGVQKGAVTVGSVRQRGGIPQEFLTMRDALGALDLGMVEAVVGESETMMYLINEMAVTNVRIVGSSFDTFDFGLATPGGSPLREELNTVLLRMREDGQLDRIKERWLGKHD